MIARPHEGRVGVRLRAELRARVVCRRDVSGGRRRGDVGERRWAIRETPGRSRLLNIREELDGDASGHGHSAGLAELPSHQPTDELRNRLVEHYLPLVKYNAERIWSRLPDGVELDDLISAGVFGLMDAIDAFDLDRGVKFETYCVPRIRGAMLDELRTMDWVPRLVRSKASKMEEARKALEAAARPAAAARRDGRRSSASRSKNSTRWSATPPPSAWSA